MASVSSPAQFESYRAHVWTELNECQAQGEGLGAGGFTEMILMMSLPLNALQRPGSVSTPFT